MSLLLDPATQDLLFREARTANTFTDEPVSDAQLEVVYDLVKYGPTAFNTNPLRVVVLRTPAARERLLAHLAEGNRPRTTTAHWSRSLSRITSSTRNRRSWCPMRRTRRTPTSPSGRCVRRPAALNGALQAAYFLIAIRAAGLAAEPMTGYDAEGLRKEFLDDDHSPLMVVNIGRPGPDAWFPRLPRLAYEQVLTSL
jgi:3-hydroxypropanoate dehydrogenase